MGMFSSSSKTEYHNATLDAYTKGYRSFAPWSFATLDPTAALASMGSTTKLGGVGGTGVTIGPDVGADFKADLQKRSDYEKELFNMEQKQVQRIQKRQESGEFLTPQETDFINKSLDKAFAYASTTGMEDMKRFADSLAGSRGLRMSDTPVAGEAMKEMRNLQLGIGSQRAGMGLQATLQTSAQQQQFEQGFAQFLASLRTGSQSERMSHLFGGGMTGAANVGYTSKTTYNPSTMSNIMQTMSMVKQGFELVGDMAGVGKQLSGMGGGASSMSPGQSSVSSSMSGVMGGMAMSDRRLKSHMIRIGTHKLGIGIYTYQIFGQQDVGVMADELLLVKPEAVYQHPSGHLMVDYAQI